MKINFCEPELCHAEAKVFSPADAALLCRKCDEKVHTANFLVARHIRHSVCSDCRNLTGNYTSGVGFKRGSADCAACAVESYEADDSISSSSSSASYASSTTSPGKEYSGSERKKNLRSDGPLYVKSEGILSRWCLMLGVEEEEAGMVVKMAIRAVRVWLDGRTVLPSRVCLAAAMWVGLRLSGRKPAARRPVEKRLEEISGVPAAVISAGGWKAEQALRGEWRRCRELKEGWAEC